MQIDTVIWEFEGFMVAGGEHEAEKRLAGFPALLLQPRQFSVRFIKDIFIAGAPARDKMWVFDLIDIDNLTEAVAGEKTAHIVEMGLASVNELGMETRSFQD